jgi:hypothetical protein
MKISRNYRQLKNRFVGLLLLVTYSINAQSVFKPGYIIDLKNDTLFGDIDYRGDILMGEKCVFKSASTGNIVEYKPDAISAYRFKDDRFFIAKEYKGKKVFLEFLIKGKVNIYYLRDKQTDRYFIEKEDEKIMELPYSEKLIYGKGNDNDRMYLSTSKTHKSILKRYMKDAPEFQSRIDELAKPEHDELIKLAKDYHNKVCKDETCIIYKKKIVRINVNLEIVGGVIRYNSTLDIINKNYFQAGLLGHIWLPRVNEKLYLRTGFIYFNISITSSLSVPSGAISSSNIFKIPVQLEYIYPLGRVRPVFAYGVNIYHPLSALSVGFMGGINAQFSDKISLAVNYDVDFVPNPYLVIIPSTLFSNSLLVGLKIRL